MKKAVLAGGTGFVGQYMKKRLQQLGYEVVIISRQKPHVSWENKAQLAKALEGAELLVNLAGKSVNCRYSKANKQAIMQSWCLKAAGSCPSAWSKRAFLLRFRNWTKRLKTFYERKKQAGEIIAFWLSVMLHWLRSYIQKDLLKG